MQLNKIHATMLFLFLLILTSINPPASASVPELLQLDDGYLLTGLLDVTIGGNHLDGVVEPVADSDHYPEGIYFDGRLAFYLKGRIKGSTLITAWLDSAADSANKTIFEKLDPIKYYPVYGDDSTTYRDISSQGNLYLKLDNEDYQAIWGNFQAELQGSELSSYNRSLYGLQIQLEDNGEIPTIIKGFYSRPDSIHARDTLLSTGGLLYYLRHGNLIIGSERVQVEIKDSLTDRILSKHTLAPGDDFQLDYLQGRLILTSDIINLAESERLVKDNLQAEKVAYLVVEYDYEADLATVNQATIGTQLSVEPAEGLIVSNNVYRETANGYNPYNLYGLDLDYARPGGFHFDASYAKSTNVLSGKNISDDGGITYREDSSVNSAGGEAYQLSASFNLNDVREKLPDARFVGRYNHWDKGFTNQRQTYLEETDQYDLSLTGNFSSEVSYRSQYIHDPVGSKLINDIRMLHPYNDRVILQSEVRHTSDNAAKTQDFKGALKAEYQLAPRARIFASQQLTLYNSNHIRDDRTAIGTEVTLGDQFNVNLEGSTGTAGNSVELGGRYDYGRGQIYSGVSVNEQEAGHVVETTLGGRGQVGDNATVFSERKTASGDEESTSDVVGLTYAFGKKLSLTLDYTNSDVVTAQGEAVDREVLTPGVAYIGEDLEGRLKFQHRADRGTERLDQYVITSGMKYRYNKELSFSLNLDHSRTKEMAAIAEYSEASVGFAFRPIRHDRLNLLGMYTYQVDTAPKDQLNVAENEERAQVFALEGIYELNQYWQLAEKIAYKKAAVRVGPDLHSSDTYLWATRANYRVGPDWDAYGEYRQLRNYQAQDHKDGFLVGFTRDLGENMEIGIGYNFSGFNDDLTRLNYNARGLFINFLRKW